VSRLLVRDLRQVVSPAGSGAPLRGAALGEIELVEDAYVLCDENVVVEVGRMRDLEPLDGDVEELFAGGRCAIPGLVDCHTHPAFGGDRVDEFSLRARGAGYEELHAAGGGILSTVRATREAGESGLRAAVSRHRGWMLGHGTTRSRASRATVSTARPSSRLCGPSRPQAASRPGSAPTPSRPSSTATPTRTSTSR
jgi:imidazolonepropionase